MSFLRRLLGRSAEGEAPSQPASAAHPGPAAQPGPAPEEDEAAYQRALALEEARRLDDDLIQRQLRFADRAWTPPAQGGTRRAGEEDPGA